MNSKKNNISSELMNPSSEFILTQAGYYKYLRDRPVARVANESYMQLSVKHEIIPFLQSIRAIKIENDLVLIDKVEENLNYYDNHNKYILYLYYKYSKIKPKWIHSVYKGRSYAIKKDASDVDARKPYTIFKEVGLLDNTNESQSWWEDAMTFSRQLQDHKEAEKKDIGNKGERLSMQYEFLRHCKPERCSLDDESLGYDIISQEDQNNKNIIYIETKASIKSFENAEAIITRKETKTAKSFPNYFFHFWDISCEKNPKLAIIDGKKVIEEAPIKKNSGEIKEWICPFRTFEKEFFEPKINF